MSNRSTGKAAGAGPSGILIVNKPTGWTSHDVVAKVRRLLKTRKVGHTGTLDPLGTGVLPVCVGNATKVAGLAQDADKSYRVTMKLGVSTDTQDSTGEVTATVALDDSRDWDALIREQLDARTGTQMQTPPMYAAVKIDGEALYKKARRGETVARPARQITIHSVTDISIDVPYATFTMSCTKGTYVRTFVSDLGDHLGVGAHLTELTRVQCGPISIDEAVSLTDLEARLQQESPQDVLHDSDYLLTDLPALVVSEYTARRMVQGIAPHMSEWRWQNPTGDTGLPMPPAASLCCVYSEQRGFFALVEIAADGAPNARIRRIIKND